MANFNPPPHLMYQAFQSLNQQQQQTQSPTQQQQSQQPNQYQSPLQNTIHTHQNQHTMMNNVNSALPNQHQQQQPNQSIPGGQQSYPNLSNYPQQQHFHQHQHQQQQQQQLSQQQNANQRPFQYEMDHLSQRMGSMSVQQNWNQLWRSEAVNLLAEKDLFSKAFQQKLQESQQAQQNQQQQQRCDLSCDKDVMRCTMRKVPETASLLQKSRLPLGILLHPFKDDPNIPVIQDSVIVRCRTCRTYINPYVRLLDQRRWQCNLCHRINEVPEEFVYDYNTRQHIDIMTRPELNHGSIEFIASVEYMVRSPQPAIYLFVFECSASAVQLGYTRYLAEAIRETLDKIPGDSRTLLGFISFDSRLHFFNLNEEQPVHMIMPDIHDVFLPHADCLLVKFHTCRKKIEYFLDHVLPKFPSGDQGSSDNDPLKNVAEHQSALGPALQVAFKLISPTGGRITLIQTSLPNAGNLSDGCVLQNREDPNQRTINSSSSNQALTPLLNPSTDFFKKLALECTDQQLTVDLFNLSSSFSDLATVGAIAKHSGGSIKYYGNGGNPSSPASQKAMLIRFKEDMKHYLSRTIGFEAVMRIRTSRGIDVHTFHGNFFVRGVDLVALPNVNPDSAYGIQMSISEDLKEFNQVCFQAALLYTNSTGERRIRVHTITLPVVSDLRDIMDSIDQDAVCSLLAKMAVDRSCLSSIQDAREALINANIDLINAFRMVNSPPYPGLYISHHARLLPLYTLALLKHTAFRLGISTRIDERVYAMEKMKTMPIKYLMLYIYPHLYPIHYQFDPITSPPVPLQLTFANIDRNGVYLLDTYDHLFIYICKSVHPQFMMDVFQVTQWSQIPDDGDQNTTTTQIASSNLRMNHINTNQMNGFLPNQQQQQQLNNSIEQEQKEQTIDHQTEADEKQDDENDIKLNKKNPIVTLPYYDNATSQRIHAFINKLIDDRPFKPSFHILREDSRLRYSFLQYMYDDRNESAFSYYEFIQHLQQNLEK